MHPFVFFALVLFAIFVLSSIASAISKQQDAARRRQVRQDIDPMGRQQLQQQLNPGYQVRHPEMLASRPRPPSRAQPRAPMPVQPIAAMPQRPQQRQRPRRRGPAVLPPPPIPAMQGNAPRSLVAQGAAKPVATKPAAPAPVQSVKAPAIARWLNPATLRQQFILTEVFQPPLAMRDERLA